MDDFRLIITRSKLNVNRSYPVVKKKLIEWCETNDVDYDADSQTGVWTGRSNSVFYEWDIEAIEEGYVINQEIRIPTGYLKAKLGKFVTPILMFGLLFVLQTYGIPTGSQNSLGELSFFGGGILILLVLAFYIPYMMVLGYKSLDLSTIPDPLVEGQKYGYGYRKFGTEFFDNIHTIGMYVLFGVAVYIGDPSTTLLLGSLILSLGLILVIGWYADGGNLLLNLRSNTKLGNVKLSSVPKQYLKSVIRLTIIILVFIAFTETTDLFFNIFANDQVSRDFLNYVPNSIPIFDTLMVIIVGIYAIDHLRDVSNERMKISYFDFKERESSLPNKLVDALGIVFASLLLYVVMIFSLELLLGVNLLNFSELRYGVDSTLKISALIVLYFPIGIVYQHLIEQRRTEYLLNNSNNKTISLDDYQADYRLLSTDEIYAASFSTRNDDYIVISEGLKERLEKRPLAAIIAHEEAHIINNDTRLSNLIIIASSVLLTGKNVLYTLVDFQSRECAADDYAAETVDNEAIIAALSSLKEEVDEDVSYESFGANFAPNFEEVETKEYLNVFKLYFGGFALGNAHYSLGKRIKRLK